MKLIEATAMPDQALLQRYRHAGAYTECYRTLIPVQVSHPDYVRSFYCTRLFKLERLILSRLLGRPSSDQQAHELASGERDAFAAWTVESRAHNQLLLCDYAKRTRSWLMSEPDGQCTRLYFGSAVVHPQSKGTDPPAPSLAFRALLSFHKRYTVALLRSARAALLTGIADAPGQRS